MIKNTVYRICFILLSLMISSSCHRNDHKSTKGEQTYHKNLINSDECKTDTEVINQIFQQIIDSLDSNIKLNLGKAYSSFKIINTLDSLRDFGDDYSVLVDAGLNLDSIDFHNKEICRITFTDTNLSKRIRTFSTPIEYHDSLRLNPIERVYLVFSRVHFNKEKNEACLTISLSYSYNTGSDFAIFAIKRDKNWIIKRIIISSIS